ncbi:hypothetical protein SAY86_027043 [Trapa natans]|uniref:Uncharacterized protein n=1 Tax=Trapa natans TaxID=22666 RepID=A0AAN7KQH3_TRANT|nr:hypothetical protein SAY86_027043 [Trapa natans]
MRKDEYEVREKPTLNTWMLVGLDYIMLQYLNIDGIRTIGSVLGQSIALDYYVRQHNIRFLQEILQNRKSDFLEWLIIVLIAAEILISVYDIFVRSAITKR